MKNFNTYFNLIETINSIIPDGTCEEYEQDGMKISYQKDKDNFKLHLEVKKDEKFDDTEIKEIIAEYKKNIKLLDDDIFVKAAEEIGKKLDLKKFNDLLDLEKFDENQAKEVEEMMNKSVDIICHHLQHKIQDMIELYDSF